MSTVLRVASTLSGCCKSTSGCRVLPARLCHQAACIEQNTRAANATMHSDLPLGGFEPATTPMAVRAVSMTAPTPATLATSPDDTDRMQVARGGRYSAPEALGSDSVVTSRPGRRICCTSAVGSGALTAAVPAGAGPSDATHASSLRHLEALVERTEALQERVLPTFRVRTRARAVLAAHLNCAQAACACACGCHHSQASGDPLLGHRCRSHCAITSLHRSFVSTGRWQC